MTVPLEVRAGNHVGNSLMEDSSLILEGKKLLWAHRRREPEWVTSSPAIRPWYFRVSKVSFPGAVDAGRRRQARDATRR